MANGITYSTTWTANYPAEIALRPILQGDNLFRSDIYYQDTTVMGSKTITKLGIMSNLLQAGACGFNAQGTAALGELTISTCDIKINVEECYDVWYDTQFNGALFTGTRMSDLGGTVVGNALMDNTMRSAEVQTFKLGWFGNTSLASTTDYYLCDGWFKRLEQNSNVEKVDIATTGDLAANEALDILRAVYNAQPILKQSVMSNGKGDKIFLVTDTIYENLTATYENLGNEGGLMLLKDGLDTVLTFRGIEVRPELTWDAVIAAEGYSDPHRVVFTTKKNLIFGTDVRDIPDNYAVIKEDEFTSTFYIKFRFSFGTQILFDEHVVYAR